MLIRKVLYINIPAHSDIDNILPLYVISQGKKIFYAEDAKAYDKTASSEINQYKKRIRTTQRSFSDMISCLPSLIRKKNYSTIFILFSHRFIRWCTGIFLIIIFLITLTLSLYLQSDLYIWNIYLYIQLIFYLFAVFGFMNERRNIKISIFGKFFSIIYSFMIANTSFTIAICRMIFGYKITSWKSTSS